MSLVISRHSLDGHVLWYKPVTLVGERTHETVNSGLCRLLDASELTVPTVKFKVLFVFVILAHDRRRVVHLNVTATASTVKSSPAASITWASRR
jgi:hypothetical protein